MNKYRLLILLLSFMLISKIKAQDAEAPDYLEDLALDITKGAKGEREKVDAIFYWVTDNIAYDIETYNQGLRYPKFNLRPTFDTAEYWLQYNEAVAKMVLDKKKGVCDGYARLFKVLCYYSDIECEVVTGVVNSFLSKEPASHAWNAVKIKGKWHLIDPTWASGSVSLGGDRYKKERQMFYYLTPPEKLIVDHYPDDPKWTLLKEECSYDNFLDQVLQGTEPYINGLIDFYPKDKLITVPQDGLIRIWLEFNDSFDPYDITLSESNSESRASKSNLEIKGHMHDSIWAADPEFFMRIPKIKIVETKVTGNRIEYLIKPLTDDLKGLIIYVKSSFPSLIYKIEKETIANRVDGR